MALSLGGGAQFKCCFNMLQLINATDTTFILLYMTEGEISCIREFNKTFGVF